MFFLTYKETNNETKNQNTKSTTILEHILIINAKIIICQNNINSTNIQNNTMRVTRDINQQGRTR